ncbi:hypothetical protein GIB67_038581 [Kingdonia uniflora]|uniref:CONSTANS-like protein n=1 Tax=Kingdonia uniflora TaxID=39325 RepID=A0A7J7NQ34_9MAGN|nr:hypothetical protein GIB67_038581 [Kingdonia uniflora]
MDHPLSPPNCSTRVSPRLDSLFHPFAYLHPSSPFNRLREMLKEEAISRTRTRLCDSCRAAAGAVYCRTDTAYLCTGCDARIHQVASHHERVWVCEACENAPASITCKADAAVLCTTCDADIHSANPLAQRHHRVPIMPISGSCLAEEDDEDETSSWLLLNPIKNNGTLLEVDQYLDLGEYNSSSDHQMKNDVNDSVVPVQCGAATMVNEDYQQQKFALEMGYNETSNTEFSYTPPSLSHSVSFSSMDTSINVPDSMMTDILNSNSRPPKGTIDLFSSPTLQMAVTPQFTLMDREARVLRYREKRKTRKFEKTIRYASRKAYAETRPRIKGRFAKRTDAEIEVDHIFSTTVMTENGGYGIVPSF